MVKKIYTNAISCPGKIPYKNKVAAQQAAQHFGTRKKSDITFYKCSNCGDWRIGRTGGKKSQKRNNAKMHLAESWIEDRFC